MLVTRSTVRQYGQRLQSPYRSELKSCTTEVQLTKEFTLDGQRVLLVDTPNFGDAHKTDVDILKLIAAFLATT